MMLGGAGNIGRGEGGSTLASGVAIYCKYSTDQIVGNSFVRQRFSISCVLCKGLDVRKRTQQMSELL